MQVSRSPGLQPVYPQFLSFSAVARSGVAAASCDLASVTAARALVAAVVRTKTIQRIFPETKVHFTETKLHPMAA